MSTKNVPTPAPRMPITTLKGEVIQYRVPDSLLNPGYDYFSPEGEKYESCQAARDAHGAGKEVYRWVAIYFESDVLDILLFEKDVNVTKKELEAVLQRAAEASQPGEKEVSNDRHARSSEQRLWGYRAAGYGKTEGGVPWWDVAYVCNGYRGMLR